MPPSHAQHNTAARGVANKVTVVVQRIVKHRDRRRTTEQQHKVIDKETARPAIAAIKQTNKKERRWTEYIK